MTHGLRPFGSEQPLAVLAAPEFLRLAMDLVQIAPTQVQFIPISWATFPDGTPNIKLDAAAIEGRDVVFLGSPTGNVIAYFAVVYAVPRYHARTFSVVTPYFHTGTMERVEHEGEVATAKTLARMMSSTPPSCAGSTNFVFFDIHALVTRFYFSDTIKVVMVSAVPLLLRHLQQRRAHSKELYPVIVFPDDGAKKRFSRYFSRDQFEIAYCAKVRSGNERRLTLREGTVTEKNVLIVDDLVQSGGTLQECLLLLHQLKCTSVSAYVTHAVFPGDSWKKFLPDPKLPDIGFSEFFVTDSVPETADKVRGRPPFTVLSLAEQICNVFCGKSMSSCKL